MEVSVCNLPSDNLGSILLRLIHGLHFLTSEVSNLHTRVALCLELVDHNDDETDGEEEEHGRDDYCLPDWVVLALRGHVAIGFVVDVAAARVVSVTI